MKNNKGFSLVELIIVIAIMAVLVGVIAPQLLKYIEKSNVSADTQLCDAVRTAIEVASVDPKVMDAADSQSHLQAMFSGNARALELYSGNSEFKTAVKDIMGFDVFDGTQAQKRFKSTPARDDGYLMVQAKGNNIAVWIVHSDNTGMKNDRSGVNLSVITDEIIAGKY